MYPAVLVLHSVLRWAVLALALVVIARAASGVRDKRAFDDKDRKLGGAFLGVVHTQLLLGMLLEFWLSPITQAAFAQMGAAMRDKTLRFWAVEHITMGVAVAALVTVTRVASKKAPSDEGKHKRALYGYGAALVLMLAMIPWPFRPVVGRGLLPSTGAPAASAAH